MNPRTTVLIIAVLIIVIFGRQFMHQVPAGHVGVAILFGEVQNEPYAEGLQIPVNPLLSWQNVDVRQKSNKLTGVDVPTRDQLLTKIDLSIQYRLNGQMAPQMIRDTGDENAIVSVHLIPKVRSLVREVGTKVTRAEDFFLEETRDRLASEIQAGLAEYVATKGIIIDSVLIRGINLPPVLTKAIELKKEREQAVEQQKAELERIRIEQQQQVAVAQAARVAAEEEAKKVKILADAQAYEIGVVARAVAKNPTYIQLKSLEALKKMSEDPAAKLYFMDSQSTNPLPLLHLGQDR